MSKVSRIVFRCNSLRRPKPPPLPRLIARRPELLAILPLSVFCYLYKGSRTPSRGGARARHRQSRGKFIAATSRRPQYEPSPPVPGVLLYFNPATSLCTPTRHTCKNSCTRTAHVAATGSPINSTAGFRQARGNGSSVLSAEDSPSEIILFDLEN
jgi:hypothetical protein